MTDFAKDAEHCKHALPDCSERGRAQWSYALCDHPKCRDGDHRSFCTTQRHPGYGLCGVDAKLFEAKGT